MASVIVLAQGPSPWNPTHPVPLRGWLLVTTEAGPRSGGQAMDSPGSPARAAAQAYDATARAELWRRSLELTGHPDIG